MLVLVLSGSIFGLHLGLKIAEKLNPSEYKTLLATLLLVVGIMMGFQEFVLEKGENLFVSKKLSEPTVISDLSQYLLNFSSNFSIYYAVLSIVLVIFIGAIFSYVRDTFIILRLSFRIKKLIEFFQLYLLDF